MNHALTVDIEDWNEAFGRAGMPVSLRGTESRIELSARLILDALARRNAHATFFVLGTVAQSHPNLIRSIAREGHRIGCHGWEHRALDFTDAPSLRRDLDRCRKLLQDLSGQPVLGYRAPWFSLSSRTTWALDVLVESGFSYDSSCFPAWNPLYGQSSARLEAHRHSSGLIEVPLAVASVGPVRIPVAGGFYWRTLPWSLLRWGIERIERDRRPAVLYLHPWECDPGQPRVWQGPFSSFIHYLGLSRMSGILDRVLERWNCSAIESVFPEVQGA